MPSGMEKDNLSITIIHGTPSPDQVDVLTEIYVNLFADAKVQFFKSRLATKEDIIALIAYYDSIPVGFKVGFKYNNDTYYSWVGGVTQRYRNQGIAQRLANVQEKEVRLKGYSRLRTKSMNRFKPMMILNLKNGFDITKVYVNDSGQTKIIFEKDLT